MPRCGCNNECCGICDIAAKAGRPRLTGRPTARDWPPPDLTSFRGASKKADRNADDGEPMLWFWQMEGRRWQLDGRSFDVAKRAWKRLAATEDIRRSETEGRYDRADAAIDRDADEQERVQRAEQAARLLTQRRERVSDAQRLRSRLRQARSEHKRDPNPRFAMLRALRALSERAERLSRATRLNPTEPLVEGGVCAPFLGVGTTQLMELQLPLDDPHALMARVTAARGSCDRPKWADWWPSPPYPKGCGPLRQQELRSWASQVRSAECEGWDGSWTGQKAYSQKNVLGERTSTPVSDMPAFRWRLDTLRLEFIESCLPPSLLPPHLPEPAVPDLLWDVPPEDMSSDEDTLLGMWCDVTTYNDVLDEYEYCYGDFFVGSMCNSSEQLPPIAAGAHAWAPSVLRQVISGERPPVKLENGKWRCDAKVKATLSFVLQRPPSPPPLPPHIAKIVEVCESNEWDEWPPFSWRETKLGPAPYVDELRKYFQGEYQKAWNGSDGDKHFPASLIFGGSHSSVRGMFNLLLPPECQQKRQGERPVHRVKLNLRPFLLTRGSHCRLDSGELDLETGACDCSGQLEILAKTAPSVSAVALPLNHSMALVGDRWRSVASMTEPRLESESTEVAAVLRYVAARKAEFAREDEAFRQEQEREEKASRERYRLEKERKEKAKERKRTRDAELLKTSKAVKAVKATPRCVSCGLCAEYCDCCDEPFS